MFVSLAWSLLCVRMADRLVLVDSAIVQNLAVLVLLRTTTINRFIKNIFPAKRKAVAHNSEPVSIMLLTVQTSNDYQEDIRKEGSMLLVLSEDMIAQEIQVVRKVKMWTKSQCALPVSTKVSAVAQVSFLIAFLKMNHLKTESGWIDRLILDNKSYTFPSLNALNSYR